MPKYPDTAEGAKQLLRDESNLHFTGEEICRPDPQVRGVWEVLSVEWRAIVYLGGYSYNPYYYDDFEVDF